MSLPSRFWAKVEKTDGCWNWTASTVRGYGRFGIFGKTSLAHRLAYESEVGPIPEGLTIDHLCRNPRCVRPDHLEPVTLKVNIQRAAATITHCKYGHELSQIGERRRCRPCETAWSNRGFAGDAVPQGLTHGSMTTYSYYHCRCSACRQANADYKRACRERVAIERAGLPA